MAYEQKPGYFSLWPNDKKEKDTHPDWKGTIKLSNGTEHYFDAWNKVSSNGKAYLSGKIGNPKNGHAYTPERASAPIHQTSTDSDVPF
jgi:uncharacterized protein (DUF736 family)